MNYYLGLGERRGSKPKLHRYRLRSGNFVLFVQPLQQQHHGGYGDHIAH